MRQLAAAMTSEDSYAYYYSLADQQYQVHVSRADIDAFLSPGLLDKPLGYLHETLKQAENLKSLNIFNDGFNDSWGNYADTRFSLLIKSPLEQLQHLTLRGFKIDKNDLLTLLASLPSLRSLELRFSTFSSPYSLPPLLLDMRQRLGWGKRPVAMRPKVTFVWAGPTRLEGQIVKHVSYDLVDITDITELDEFEPAHERLNFSGRSQQQIRRAGWQAIYNGKVKNGLSSLECTQVLEIRDQRRSGNASIADCEHMFMILR
ncbi:hypothetical protein FOCG_09153 [Fusarium oxysporum f. sp. radicis-lycopersici 26381]|uniref:F-box domain-containing protein n=1 Tax=Fusarium oxysporum Fo47 TaxID=660027 RepID=W9KBZ3_FUSOX|nr:uncharacterized protein FOBCDRAFT_275445 [Fusarium oxysporum Fo47]EWZ39480.1 hypothetical protein FOZG_08563 [Fusarium oxysporum Fo47]EXL51027.1 hypothetical protein FOCG_09153 [Fusarium oxysporum f. sp. radicis-lycopersici 26381]QKD55841.2 hypothetical protein FOBCDRAFT_275445 [Fusarium oxysporum Fo47]